MILTLIGPGDLEFHYNKLLNIQKENFQKQIENIAKILAESEVEIELLPDKGISFEIAKLYKKYNGKKITAALPKSDKTFGIKHLEPYLNEKINHKPLFDNIIDSENWYKHDLIKGLFGNAVLYLGSSPGTDLELNGAVYIYKLLTGRKEGVEVAGKYVHPEVCAGNNFTIFVYSPFLTNKKLSKEQESYIKKFNINLVYIKNPEQLKQELKKFI